MKNLALSNQFNIKLLTLTVPSLQGTLAKRTKPALQPNFAKEPFRPSRSNAEPRDNVNMLDKRNENKNRQCLTRQYMSVCRIVLYLTN